MYLPIWLLITKSDRIRFARVVNTNIMIDGLMELQEYMIEKRNHEELIGSLQRGGS